MGRIVSPFSVYLAQDGAPEQREQYGYIIEDLTGGSHPLPEIPIAVITHDQMELHLQTVAGNRLKLEIEGHPELYGGKTAQEIPQLFVGRLPGADPHWDPIRMCVAWWRIPLTPNQITAEDVISAMET